MSIYLRKTLTSDGTETLQLHPLWKSEARRRGKQSKTKLEKSKMGNMIENQQKQRKAKKNKPAKGDKEQHRKDKQKQIRSARNEKSMRETNRGPAKIQAETGRHWKANRTKVQPNQDLMPYNRDESGHISKVCPPPPARGTLDLSAASMFEPRES
jgi:hypothetical protein